MLPGVIASELREAVSQFLRSAFPIATPFFQSSDVAENTPHALIDDLLARPGALFKGPYLDIRLPFRPAEQEELPFRHITLSFQPYQHQLAAFQRLCGNAPQSTIVATGTGSGKTECFMLPVLDDCLNRREQGIKTLIIYPMNALATDQARRFAAEIHKLDTRLTVGLFVGGEQKNAHTIMGPNHVITCQNTLRENPPDILLTNYKMLDFLLIRPRDQRLWRYNTPGMLRYLVVDELHTFDGAQGTDLACLIRRLRDRLEAGPELACVGTSATMGAESVDDVLTYASQVFATRFSRQALIGENRLTADEYLLGSTETEKETRRKKMRFFNWPDRHEDRLDPKGYKRAGDYLFHQARLWFQDLAPDEVLQLDAAAAHKRAAAAVRLGKLLHEHQAFHELIRATERLTDFETLAADWQQKLQLPTVGQSRLLLNSLISLVAVARLWRDKDSDEPEKWCQPFLQVRQQLWLRELRRMVCSVPVGAEKPAIRFADDLQNPQKPLHLPLLHCRECHMAAWGAVAKKGDNHLVGDLQSFYQAWFGYSPQSTLLVPWSGEQPPDGLVQGFCPRCLRLQTGGGNTCAECREETLREVRVPDMLKTTGQGSNTRLQCHHDCPECEARDSLAIVGYRAATLTSVMVGRLFSTPYNDDFKLIAFSDSVQDAAHRAGFLGANTWRQVIRQALAIWLENQPMALSLKEMTELLPTFWRDRINHDGRFCGLFIAPNMTWLSDYRALTENGALPARAELPELVTRRLAWECVAEFGRRSVLGRSLERTGTASISLDWPCLVADVRKLAEHLREEVESLRHIDDAVFVRFVLGWLHHMRQVGAIHDPVLESYLKHKGTEYQLNRLSWMPGFGRSRRPPAAITLRHVAPNFEAVLLNNRDSWLIRWLKKTLGRESLFAAAEASQIFQRSLSLLTGKGWLIEREAAGQSLWLLNPDRLLVDSTSGSVRCNRCRHPVPVGESGLTHYAGMPCLRPGCLGVLEVDTAAPRSQAYGVTEPRRLVPGEHTGLLPPDVRGKVERSFMDGHEPWDINLLSATPTLEMGIDIGELSSLFLCSVPPAQANYLQRIGRAGRRDGNALAVTVANGRNHDLYFYGNPPEMIAGAVHTPGVFLQAIAVLERQLIAYCFDRWTATGIDESALPGQLRKVLDTVEQQRGDRFPYNLIHFIRQHRASLLANFLVLFDELDDEARAYLEGFMHDEQEGGLEYRLVIRLQQMVEQRKSLRNKTRELKNERERLKKQPQDDATKALIESVEQERGALLSLLSSINNQPVLNFFTDEGLLPNYAFPEEGVTLRSVILARRSKEQRSEGESAFEKTSYVFQRPARAALGELAPESRFYAVSHEMEIDRIDLQLSEAEAWRFCDRCQYTERVDLADCHSACPRCGSPQWADSGQKHTVLRLRQVYSTVDDRANRIGDDSEQREPSFFNRQMLVDIPEQGHQGGFRLKSDRLPFGFEYLRRMTLREVNFGTRGGDANTFSVAGRELSRRGFRICRHCGRVQKERPRRNEPQHGYTCKLRKHPEQETPEDYFASLYLYRELDSEAIRILLPLSEVAYSEEKLHSFIAALNLGLRSYFRGDVHHLEVTEMREPATMASGERVYLVIYDRIPGGTGYLKELMRAPDNLLRVLALAHQRLTRCACIDDEHLDGCYRCILAYRDSRNMATISRKGAAALLADILALRDRLEPVATLSEINTNVLVESKLEQKFVDALGQLPGARMSKAMVNGKAGHLLTLPGAEGRPVAWQVEHQVMAGPTQGVALQTRIDVLLVPARAEDAARYRPIAVYLDGLQYHHDSVADDVAKRSALLLSGRYRVWSLNWDDLPEPGKPVKPQIGDIMRADGPEPSLRELFDQLAGPAGWLAAAEHLATHARGGLERLFELLRNPACGQGVYLQLAVFRGFTALAPKVVKDAALRHKIEYALADSAPGHVREALALDQPDRIPGGFMAALGNPLPGIELTVALPIAAMQSAKMDALAGAMRVHLCFDDRDTEMTPEFKERWRAFWHAANQLQFLPGFSMATRSAVASGQLDQLWSAWQAMGRQPAELPGASPDGDDWTEVFVLSVLDPEVIRALSEQGVPVPEVGIDLISASGEVVLSGDCVELCWRAHKVAVVHEVDAAVLSDWRLIAADDKLIHRLGELMEEGVFG